MRLVVFSDTHGNFAAMQKIVKRNGNADLFVFLGDGLTEYEKIKAHYIDNNFVCVKGNCDYSKEIPESDVYTLPNGQKMFMAHGDKWNVRSSADKIYEKARDEGCQFAFYGHTHCRHVEKKGNVLILNPGSAGQPRDDKPPCYCWVEITPYGVLYNFVDL